MLLLIFANAVHAFISFLPEKTVGLQIGQIFTNICLATAILHILSFYHFSKPNKWVNLIPFLGISLLTFTFLYNKNNLYTPLNSPGNIRLLLQPYYKDISPNNFITLFRITLALSFISLFFILSYKLIKKYKGYKNLFARKLKIWVLVLVIIPLLIISQNILFTINPDLIINEWITITIYYLNALIFIYRPDFINKSYLKRKLFETDNEKNEQFHFNEEIFINEFYNKAYFINLKASLQDFAESIQVPRNELARFINSKFGCSFSDLIQEKRIAFFKEIASKSEYKNYTIEALAKEVGFASRQTFYIAFKKYNGGVPTDLID
jgi:AraC-like DNA-binding protein